MFRTGPLYLANLNATEDIIINQGGTSSGKTYAIIQVLFSLAISEKAVLTVVGQDIPNLKVGALRDALEIVEKSPELQSCILSYNKTDRVFEFKSGSILEFKSYQTAQDAKSGKRDYLFVNEANGISHEIFAELYLRTRKRTFIDYNPNAEFWVHEHYIDKPGVRRFISDHRHNPFLQQKVRDKIEGLKDIDLELWKVYARGLTGKIEGLILRNWAEVDEIPVAAKLIDNGLDFGFTNDPTAVVKVYKMDRELYIDCPIYETNLTNPMIADLVKGWPGYIICDSAEPKSIVELSNMGINVESAVKGPDSVINSIDILKRFKLNVTRRSVQLKKELNNYKWRVDKATGKTINEPVDFMNHAIDALRYVALNRLADDNSGHYTIGFV